MKKYIFHGMPRRKQYEMFALHARPTIALIVRWTIALTALCALAILSINANAQTAPCKVQANCLVERDSGKQRGILENVGASPDPAETLVERDDRPRYLLRCWQRGVLINERIVLSLPPESKSVKPLTDSQGASIVAFDMKNATCMIESLGAAR
jgi:hypothetical protein